MTRARNYTHLATIYRIPCYYNIHTHEMLGTCWFYDKLIDFAIKIDGLIPDPRGFQIKIGDPI